MLLAADVLRKDIEVTRIDASNSFCTRYSSSSSMKFIFITEMLAVYGRVEVPMPIPDALDCDWKKLLVIVFPKPWASIFSLKLYFAF